MSPRKRHPRNAHLPDNLRVRNGYYSYTSRADGSEIGLGRNRAVAVQEAMKRNYLLSTSVVPFPELGLSADEILQRSVPIEQLHAIYFLLYGHEIVYVGQSTNVHGRIAQHMSDAIINFDRFHILPCPKDCLLALEAQYILALKPRYNKILAVRNMHTVSIERAGGISEEIRRTPKIPDENPGLL